MANVLIVEDDWMHRDFLVRLLQIKGYQVRAAMSGEEAMGEIQRQPPDLVVLDMGLPGISGYQVARLIRTGPDTSGIPIIALTAFALGEDQDRAIAAGCNAFETKPVDLDALNGKIQALLAHSRAGAR